jgi:type VI protein secretion system component VasA
MRARGRLKQVYQATIATATMKLIPATQPAVELPLPSSGMIQIEPDTNNTIKSGVLTTKLRVTPLHSRGPMGQ